MTQRPDKTLDIRGVAGGRARVLARETLGPMLPGQVLKLIAGGRDAVDGIRTLCRENGYALLDEAPEGDLHALLIQR